MKDKILNTEYPSYARVWKKIEPPWRPAIRDMVFCDEHIKKRLGNTKQLKALVLGATPEIRDMLHMNGIDITLFDINSEMYEAMTLLCEYEPVHEKFIQGNWLEIEKHFPKNSFNIVISDHPQDNVEFKDWPRLWRGITYVLQKGGLVFLGAWNHDFGAKNNFEDFLETYKNNPGEFDYHFNRAYHLYQLIGTAGAYNEKTHEFLYKKLYDWMLKNFDEYETSKDDRTKMWFVQGEETKNALNAVSQINPPIEITIQTLKNAGLKLIARFQDTSTRHMQLKEYICMQK